MCDQPFFLTTACCHNLVMKSALKSDCADAKIQAMKIILALMVFALAFSGFMTASHAMGPDKCSSSSMQTDNCPPEIQKSSDHSQKHQNPDKGPCLDCLHCCGSSVMTPDTKSWNPPPVAKTMLPESSTFEPQTQVFSLLRPPRTLA